MHHHESFRAMGTQVDLIVEAAAFPLDALLSARLLFERQEAIFSRFRPGSLLSRLNAGEPVTDETFAAGCALALRAHELTGGLFNPMVLPALAEAGYSRSFETVTGGRPRRQNVPDPRECLAIDGHTVRLRHGQLDLGGIVKGWTVDLAIELLAPRGEAVFVNAGGDLRCAGSEDGQTTGWWAEIEGPDGSIAWEGTVAGALATSTTGRRSWRTNAGGRAHHLIDPRTGLPAESGIAQASVWAATAWEAECLAKAVLIASREPGMATLPGGAVALALGAAAARPAATA